MQLMANHSEEGDVDCLGVFDHAVKLFPASVGKVPHMGWNQLHHDGSHPLLQGVESGAYCYFVHSYYCAPTQSESVIATTDYGESFCSIVSYGNVHGLQFHPEKSHEIGLRILQNFIDL
ncbi:MAG: imidazole glycerol phosphate synthase subunit HisH, partial [Anaerolineales bacterium]|nr:imidazole glycerol phosphate synthase subunit HisH [Anaerolineales bacterium]